MFSCPNFIKNSLKSRSIAYTQYLLPICANKIKKKFKSLERQKSIRRFKKLLGSMKIRLIKWSAPNVYYYMAFQNSALFRLVDKRSVKTHIRTVVRIFHIWTGVPDVVYLAGNFCFANRKIFCFLIFNNCALQIKISNNQIVFD